MQTQTMIVSILLLVTSLTFAEVPQDSISGLIVDQNNTPVEGVTIRAATKAQTRAATKAQTASLRADELLTTKTDQDGKFSLFYLFPIKQPRPSVCPERSRRGRIKPLLICAKSEQSVAKLCSFRQNNLVASMLLQDLCGKKMVTD